MKKLLLALGLLLGLPCAANAAACSTTAYAHTAGNFSNTTAVWGTTSTSGTPTFCTLTAGNQVVFDANSGAGSYVIDEAISIAGITSTGTPAGVYLIHNAFTLTVNNTTTNTSFDISHLNYCNANPCTAATVSGRVISFTNTGGTVTITLGSSLTAPYNQLSSPTINGSGGTFAFADNAIISGPLTFTAGTLTAAIANSSPHFLTGSLNVPAVGILNCGTGTWTFDYAGGSTALFTGTPGATLSCSSSTFALTTASTGLNRSISLGTAMALGTINVSGSGAAGPAAFSIGTTANQTSTFAALNFSNITYPFQFYLSGNNATLALTAAPTGMTGTAGNFFTIGSTPATTIPIIQLPNSAPQTANWVILNNIKFTGTSSTFTATNCIDISGANNLNGGSCTAPSFGGGHIIGA